MRLELKGLSARAHIPALTGLRGVAALVLSLCHFRNEVYAVWGQTLFSFDFLKYGMYGVDIFFILSGFVIGHIHLDEFHSFNKRRLFRFAALRFFRIYPLHWFVLACLGLLVLFPPYLDFIRSAEPERLTPGNILANVLLADNWGIVFFGHPWNGVSWTLSLEILAYMAFPFLAYFVSRIRSIPLCMTLAAALLVGLGVFMLVTNNLDNNLKWRGGILRVACEFTAGVLLNRSYRLGLNFPLSWVGLFAVAWIALCLLVPYMHPLVYLGLGGLIVGLSFETDIAGRLCESRLVAWLGEISFSFYLVHGLLLQGLMWALPPMIQQWSLPAQGVVVVAATMPIFLIAWGVNVLVERPSRNIGRAVVKRFFPP